MEAVPAGAEAAPAAEAPDSAEISPEYEQPEVRAVAAGKRKHGSALEGAENKVNVLNLMLPHGSRVPLVYPLRTTCLMLYLFRVHTKCPDTCFVNLHAGE